MQYKMRIIKPNGKGGKDIVEIPLTNIDKILTPEEIFFVEFRLNETIPTLRFHIEEDYR